MLLLEHPLGDSASGNKHIDVDYITGIMSTDWGFHHTFTTNLNANFIAEFPAIRSGEADVIRSRVDDLLQAIDDGKSMKWKMRGKIGTRVKWYQEVTEKSEQFCGRPRPAATPEVTEEPMPVDDRDEFRGNRNLKRLHGYPRPSRRRKSRAVWSSDSKRRTRSTTAPSRSSAAAISRPSRGSTRS